MGVVFFFFNWLCRNAEETKQLFEKYKPTHVIHLAALGVLPGFIGVLTLTARQWEDYSPTCPLMSVFVMFP